MIPSVLPAPAPQSRWLVPLVAAYVFFLPMQFASASMNFAPSDVILLICILVGLRHLKLVRSVWSIPHGALIGAFLIGTFSSAATTGGLTQWSLIKISGLFLLFVSYLVVTSVASSWDHIRFLLRVLIIAVTLHTILSLGAYFAGIQLSWLNFVNLGTGRISGMLLDPNAFGGLLTLTLAVHAATLLSRRPILGGLTGALSAIILSMGLVLTLSRSAWMGFAAALLVCAAFRPRVMVACVTAGALTLVALAVALGTGQGSKIIKLADRPQTTQQRVDQVIQGSRLFVDSPIFGIGLGTFEDRNKLGVPGRRSYIIHNTTAWVTTELGLVGVAALLSFFGWFFLQGVKAYRSAGALEAPLVLGLLCAHAGMLGLSLGIEALYQRHWWLVMALIASARAVTKENMRRSMQTPASGRGQWIPALSA